MNSSNSPYALLPVHLKPLPDELHSSWLIRLAHAHGQKLQTFCAQLFGRDKALWNRDIDKLAPDWLIAKLSEVTATPIVRVMETTLRSYEGCLYERHQPNGNTRWILPLGVYHRTHRNHGLLCCPACLADDEVPYFRRSWRLALSVVCTKHNSWLIDRCPTCSSPIVPHRSDMQHKEYFPFTNQIVYCWQCGMDLRRCKSEPVKNKSLLALQRRIEQALIQGYTDWAGNPSMYSLLFFDGLRSLVTGLTTRHSIQRLSQAQQCIELTRHSWPRTGFEFAYLNNRRSLLVLLSQLLQDWPDRFQSLIHGSKLCYADLKGDSATRPYWLEEIIKREASGGYAVISNEELLSITYSVEKHLGKFTVDGARRLSGRDLSGHVPRRNTVSDEAYEDLLVAIDHQIAGTLDEAERACLIRDKIMFATGRVLGLSQSDLANLTPERLQSLESPRVSWRLFGLSNVGSIRLG